MEQVDIAEIPGAERDGRTALLLADEGHVDGAALLATLTRAAEAAVSAWVDRTVVDVTDAGTGRLALRLDGGDTVLTDRVVLAAGTGIERLRAASALLRAAGLPPVLSARGVSATLFGPVERFPRPVRVPNQDFACGAHVVPRADRLFVGATNRIETSLEEQKHTARLDEVATLFGDAMSGLTRVLADTAIDQVRVGRRPLTADKLPLVGPTLDDRVIVLGGTYRNGMVLAPLLAARIAQALSDGTTGLPEYLPTRPRAGTDDQTMYVAVVDGCRKFLENSRGAPGAHAYAAAARACAGALDGRELVPAQRALVRRLWNRAPIIENVPNIVRALALLEG